MLKRWRENKIQDNTSDSPTVLQCQNIENNYITFLVIITWIPRPITAQWKLRAEMVLNDSEKNVIHSEVQNWSWTENYNVLQFPKGYTQRREKFLRNFSFFIWDLHFTLWEVRLIHTQVTHWQRNLQRCPEETYIWDIHVAFDENNGPQTQIKTQAMVEPRIQTWFLEAAGVGMSPWPQVAAEATIIPFNFFSHFLCFSSPNRVSFCHSHCP